MEVITTQFPPVGTLLTFAQFLLVSIVGLRKQLVILPHIYTRHDAVHHVGAKILRRWTSMSKQRTLRIVVQSDNGYDRNDLSTFVQELASFIEAGTRELIQIFPVTQVQPLPDSAVFMGRFITGLRFVSPVISCYQEN